jgi:hypothetical protein
VGVDIEYKRRLAYSMLTTILGFSYPGIVSFQPAFNIDIAISADDASFLG